MKKKNAVLALLALAMAGGFFWLWRSPVQVSSAAAVVEGRVATVSAAIPGTVKEIYAAPGEAVVRDQPLLALDASGMELQLARERARLAELAALLPPDLLVLSPMGALSPSPGKPLAALRDEEEKARRQVEAASHSHAAASAAYARLEAGAGPEYATPDPKRHAARIGRDEAAITLKEARDAYERASYARAQREMQEKQERAAGSVSAALAARIAEYQAQISKARLVEQALTAAVVKSPEKGVVIFITPEPGVAVQAGDTLAAIMPEEKGEVWVLASFTGEDAARLAEGLVCEVTLDGSSVKAQGTLASIPPGAETEKTVAVRVNLDQNTVSAEFSPGKAASVSVPTGRAGLLDKVKAMLR